MILNASAYLCPVASAVQPFACLQTPKIRSSLCFSKLQYCVKTSFLVAGATVSAPCLCATAHVYVHVRVYMCMSVRGARSEKT